MGNIKNKKQQGIDPYEKLIADTFKYTGMEFTNKELLTFKLKIHDLENYFSNKFDYFVYFNSYVFKQRLSTLYDNFNTKIEEAAVKGSLSILVDFDESEVFYLSQGSKPDFDPLFTVIFEKLEMGVILFFNMTNLDHVYINEFFYQMIESIELYKYNRKFDCLYMLLPNTDFFVKNNVGIFYITNKNINTKNISEIQNEYITAIFGQENRNHLLQCKYPKTDVNDFFENFIEKSRPTFVKLMINFVFQVDAKDFYEINEEHFATLVYVVTKCQLINLVIDITNMSEDFLKSDILELALKRIIEIQINCPRKNLICVRFISEHRKIKVERNLNELLVFLNNYIKLVSVKEPVKRKFITEMYLINSTEEEFKFEIDYQKISMNFGNKGEPKEMQSLIQIFDKPEFKRLNDVKIINQIRSYLDSNYNIKITKDKQLITHDEYIRIIY
jgi:hypothetical protein